MQDIIEFIKALGFPVFVAVYVLVRIENTLKTLTESINALTTMIKLCHREKEP